MMNRFSFRAWDRTSKAMIRDYAHLKMHGELYVTQFHSLAYSDKGCPDLILMQSTGLPDKSGKEIFEGDRICIDGGGAKKPYLEVIFEEGCFGVQWPDSNFASLKYYTNMKFCTVEIIGNIYENPQPLEATNEDNP